MTKRILTVFSIVVAVVALVTLGIAAVSADSPDGRVVFQKSASNTAPSLNGVVTFVLTMSTSATETQPIDVMMIDANPSPANLQIITTSVTGGAVYSATLNGTGPEGVVWTGTLTPGSLPVVVSFQARITRVPAAALPNGYVVTNTATLNDVNQPGSLQTATAATAIRIMPIKMFLPIIRRQ